MKKLITAMMLVGCICLLSACQRTEKILVAPADKPELAAVPVEPPKGWAIEYNEATSEYRWCFPSGYCPAGHFESKAEAVKASWGQYNFGVKNNEANWKKVKSK